MPIQPVKISIAEPAGSFAALTGVPDDNAAAAAVLAAKEDGLAGVKVYRAILSQTGTNAPVATVLENSLGEVPVWERTFAGVYDIPSVGSIFLAAKTFVTVSGGNYDHQPYAYRTANNQIDLIVIDLVDGSNVDVWGPIYFEIRIYP